jgi:hypothetical protein
MLFSTILEPLRGKYEFPNNIGIAVDGCHGLRQVAALSPLPASKW